MSQKHGDRDGVRLVEYGIVKSKDLSANQGIFLHAFIRFLLEILKEKKW